MEASVCFWVVWQWKSPCRCCWYYSQKTVLGTTFIIHVCFQNSVKPYLFQVIYARWMCIKPCRSLCKISVIFTSTKAEVFWQNFRTKKFQLLSQVVTCGQTDIHGEINRPIFYFILWQTIIITLLHVSTLSCYPLGACHHCLAKLREYFKISCW